MKTVSLMEGHTDQTVHIAKGRLNLGAGEFETAFVVTDMNPAQAKALGLERLDGLLGMHDLEQFRSFKLDFQSKTLELEER